MDTITLKDLTEKVSLSHALIIKLLEDGDIKAAKEESDSTNMLLYHYWKLSEGLTKEEIK